MNSFAIAGLQLNADDGDNRASMESEIEAVVRRFPWLNMIVLSELNAFGSSRKKAEPMPGPTERQFARLAKEHGVWLLPGSIFEQDGDALYNTAPVIDPDGNVVARHRKQFPWLPYEHGVAPGSECTVFDVPGVGRFGVSICYDMWFPETVRTMAWQGAEVILHPSLTSTIDRGAEIAMIRAHAAMNQCYFFDVNLAGPLGVGQSCVAGPGGEVVHQAGRDREIMLLKLDLDYVRDVRRHGWQNLGQPLKSFRDTAIRFPPYVEGHRSPALEALGPLAIPEKVGAE